ncbi:MAG: Asp-tRNA(Asn)/Glu-tRNA(Gln) amidotransferase GatCAB subunit C [Gemmatimonadetes bacterium]|nr:MAG: Asp-tRNA(Asn)/Glu-tRNA(Gln) amidotransferase GatCAB subunit C [Gemmatimonadota bacterium]PYO76292.1 MAG: Asp-tRNA(Asn)/Glu-tRNA(Gln) amidotransferase GatCAB subunit C [Gemmatimonadota bacterium]
MAVTREDVLHIADLARLGVDSARADELTRELSSILQHMEVLSQIDTAQVSLTAGVGAGGTPLRPDERVAPLMEGTLESFAPSMRDGFFIVPRLATHEDPTESSA